MSESDPGTLGGRDPGAQPERTALSWQRTALASLVLVTVASRGNYEQPILVAISALVCIGLSFGMFRGWLNAHRRVGVWRRTIDNGGASPRAVRDIFLVAGLTIAVGVAALASILIKFVGLM